MNKKTLAILVVVVVVAVVVAIVLDTIVANHRPSITSLVAEPERVLPGESSNVTCVATDADGDELSYDWTASEGEIIGRGATITWNAPHSFGSYNVTVTVTVSDSRGGTATKARTIEVRANDPPTITTLEAEENWTIPSRDLNLTCTARDLDHDLLTYQWSATGGSISGTGPEVTWTAPEQIGVYNITVVVSDGYGGSDSRTLPVSVVTGKPPTIEDLTITAEHCYLKPYAGGYYVGRQQRYDIECVVEEKGIELFYEWSCTGGEISGEGTTITWTALTDVSKVTITVTVSDVAGNLASKNLVLSVAECSWCTFRC